MKKRIRTAQKLPKICCIYKITTPENKIYIGATKNYYSRRRAYKKNKTQPLINEQIEKHGFDSLIFEIVIECKKEELCELEKYYIKLFDTFESAHGLNMTSGGKKGFKASKNLREKYRESHLGQIPTTESIEKGIATKKANGYRHSKEHNIKVSESVKKSWEKRNRIVSNETKLKMIAGHERRRLIRENQVAILNKTI